LARQPLATAIVSLTLHLGLRKPATSESHNDLIWVNHITQGFGTKSNHPNLEHPRINAGGFLAADFAFAGGTAAAFFFSFAGGGGSAADFGFAFAGGSATDFCFAFSTGAFGCG
jgi:hypothetical protein